MRYLAFVLLLAACGKDSSGPGGLVDPTVQVTNQLANDTVFFTWRDGQGIVGTDMVLPGQTSCEKFVARPDSAYWNLSARDQQNGNALGTLTAPWFSPDTLVSWTVIVRHATSGSPDFLSQEVSTLPC